MYKGKGIKGKCSNERGITLSHNFGKLYKRINSERATKKILGSHRRASRKKDGKLNSRPPTNPKRTKEHSRKIEEKVYMAFLDVTKACDKAWPEAIM